MLWPKSDAAHYHAPLGLPDKGYAIKAFVVCYVVWQGSMIYGMGLWILTSARCVVRSLFVVRMSIGLKYRNTPQIHTNTYIHGHDICRMSYERDSTTGRKMLALTAG